MTGEVVRDTPLHEEFGTGLESTERGAELGELSEKRGEILRELSSENEINREAVVNRREDLIKNENVNLSAFSVQLESGGGTNPGSRLACLDSLFSAMSARSQIERVTTTEWELMIDSGANVSLVRKMMSPTEPSGITIRGIGGRIKCAGVGDLQVVARDSLGVDHLIQLRRVHHAPNIVGDIMSVSAVVEEGYEVVFNKSDPHMTDSSGHRFEFRVRDHLYFLPVRIPERDTENYCHTYEIVNDHLTGESRVEEVERCVLHGIAYVGAASQDLWHERMGHPSHDKILMIFEKDLAKKHGKLIVNAKTEKKKVCDCCRMANSHKTHIQE